MARATETTKGIDVSSIFINTYTREGLHLIRKYTDISIYDAPSIVLLRYSTVLKIRKIQTLKYSNAFFTRHSI